MQKKTRRTLFYGGIMLFFVVGYFTLLYAQGYRYNFQLGAFQRTGVIALRANTSAKVFVDDILIGSTSFIGNAQDIDRLLPGQYHVRLERTGYSSWEKKAIVTDGEVTDFPNILLIDLSKESFEEQVKDIRKALFSSRVLLNETVKATSLPTKIDDAETPLPTPNPKLGLPFVLEMGTLFRIAGNETREIIAENVSGFSLSRSKGRLLWWSEHELRVMWLFDTNYQPYHKKNERALITRITPRIKRAAWFPDGDHVVLDADGFKIVELDTRGGTNIIRF